jgi:hypothetical protein
MLKVAASKMNSPHAIARTGNLGDRPRDIVILPGSVPRLARALALLIGTAVSIRSSGAEGSAARSKSSAIPRSSSAAS